MEFQSVSKSELIEDYLVNKLLPMYKVGDKIPSELELAKELNTTRSTIHKVLASMTSRGFFHRKNGSGTFVSGPQLKTDTVLAVLATPSELSPKECAAWFSANYVLEGFNACASKVGIGMQIVYLHPDGQNYASAVADLLKTNAAAYLFPTLGGYGKILEALRRQGAVCIVRAPAPMEIAHSVYGLLKEGVKKGIKALADSGCRRIAFFGLPFESAIISPFEQLRLSAYEEVLKEADMPFTGKLRRICGGFPHDGYQETRRMLAEGVRPDAIFGGSDMRSFGIMQALQDAGLRIPEDVSLLGSDNLPECLEQHPLLSTVEYPMKKMGEAMFDIFRECIGRPEAAPVSRGLKCEFIRRGSMRPL